MFAVFTAEQQYRHDTRVLEREHALLAAISERSAAVAPRRIAAARVAAARVTGPASPRPQRATWPRPIGLHTRAECTTACAVA